MTKVCAKVVPKVLMPGQKENGKRICADILGQTEANSNVLKKLIAYDETLSFQYDPETKQM